MIMWWYNRSHDRVSNESLRGRLGIFKASARTITCVISVCCKHRRIEG